MKITLLLLGTLCFVSACKNRPAQQPASEKREAMLDADRAFSKMSETKGMRSAFMHYIDSNGVLLRPNSFPMIGAGAIDYISQNNDTTYTMTWEPKGGSIAASADLGYTYGVYSVKPKDQDTVLYGTYVNVWKVQPDGTWKFVLDSGNDGIEVE